MSTETSSGRKIIRKKLIKYPLQKNSYWNHFVMLQPQTFICFIVILYFSRHKQVRWRNFSKITFSLELHKFDLYGNECWHFWCLCFSSFSGSTCFRNVSKSAKNIVLTQRYAATKPLCLSSHNTLDSLLRLHWRCSRKSDVEQQRKQPGAANSGASLKISTWLQSHSAHFYVEENLSLRLSFIFDL